MLEQKTADMQKDIQIIDFNPLLTRGTLKVQETLTPRSAVYQIAYMITPDFVLTRSR